MVDSSQATNGGTYSMPADHAGDILDQLMALGKKATAAYVDVFEKTAAGIGEFQEKLETVSRSGWDNLGSTWQPGAPGPNVGDQLSKARDRALEVGDKLDGIRKRAALGYLKAYELALLAVADCHEEIAATSDLEFVKAVGGARVGFTREVTKACLSAAREMVG